MLTVLRQHPGKSAEFWGQPYIYIEPIKAKLHIYQSKDKGINRPFGFGSAVFLCVKLTN